tara:strand:- start:423 stop:950 length:528 start_codon:yes stop_codon:yes gene_type:complete
MKIMKKNILDDRGFSLIELVIVIAVLSILSAVAIPSFIGVRNNAKVSAVKKSLVNILKECLVAESNLVSNPTFNDIGAWDTNNSFGDSRGLNFGFTYDSDLTSSSPIRPSDSCFRIAAKSNTQDIGGIPVPILPHFEIFLDKTDNYKVKKNCSVANSQTINNNFCDVNAPDGSQW